MKKLFFSTIFLIYLISVIPASYAEGYLIEIDNEYNGINFLIFNFILLFVVLLFLQRKILLNFRDKIKKIFSFDLSKKHTILILSVIFSIYIIFSFNELFEPEDGIDSQNVVPLAENFEINEFPLQYFLRFFLLNLSIEIFDNIKIIPFLASNFLILFTYLITTEITKNRFGGIISVIAVLQSSLFLKYDTIAVYTNFWVLFYFISIYKSRIFSRLRFLSKNLFIFWNRF